MEGTSWMEDGVTPLVTGDRTYTFALVTDGNNGVTISSQDGSAAQRLGLTFNPYAGLEIGSLQAGIVD